MATMKAVRIHTYGGPEVLRYEDVPRPAPAAGEVLIKIHAAAVNPVDWKVRAGHLKDMLKYHMPLIPGWDAAGVIEDVGAGVARLKRGDEVYTRPDITRDGTYAEYIAVREREVALKPKSLDHVHAAAIPLAALTAWQALFDAGGLSAGQRVLIHAAAGGVGSFAVQLAKWKGAYVIGTASAHNHEFLCGLGADETIDYNTRRFEDEVHDVDMVLDAMAGETQKRSWKTLKPGGILVSILGLEDPPRVRCTRRYLFSPTPHNCPRSQSWSTPASCAQSSKRFCRWRKRAAPKNSTRPAIPAARLSCESSRLRVSAEENADADLGQSCPRPRY
jgi:NADPH:quinone reductase-like Zn-dependent oxidoreductase